MVFGPKNLTGKGLKREVGMAGGKGAHPHGPRPCWENPLSHRCWAYLEQIGDHQPWGREERFKGR